MPDSRTGTEPSFAAQLARLEADDQGRGQVSFDPSWTNGRTVFGGLGAALCVRAMRAMLAEPRPLRSLQVNFVGPLQPDQATVESRVLREGRAITQVASEIRQHDQSTTVAIGVFGSGRESAVRLSPATPDLPGPPDEFADRELPFLPGVTPDATQYVQMRFARGDWPFSGSAESDLSGWCRLRHEDGDLGAEGILALVDVWPPPVLQMQPGPAPVASLSWMIEFPQPDTPVPMQDWAFYDARPGFAANGYSSMTSRLWTGDGQLVAVSHQTVALFG